MTDIKAIFNQDVPHVWSEFASIRLASYASVADYYKSERPVRYEEMMTKYAQLWAKNRHSFAFGAYDGMRMVGFVCGYIKKGVSTIEDLFVLPEYHRQKLGSRLLNSAQQTSALSASTMELTSVPSNQAMGFYHSHGFRARDRLSWTNEMGMRLNTVVVACQVIPVFSLAANSRIAKECESIAKFRGVTFDRNDITTKHLPTFVYLDENKKVRGYIVENAKPTPVIASGVNTERIGRILLRALNVNHR